MRIRVNIGGCYVGLGKTREAIRLLRAGLDEARGGGYRRQQARAWSYFLVVSEIGLDHAGRYVDRLECRDGAWRIVHRRVVVEWSSPDSRFTLPDPTSEPTPDTRPEASGGEGSGSGPG